MAQSSLSFGCFLGQGDKDWPTLLGQFQLVEELGFDHAWVYDHFIGHTLEGWTLLAVLSVHASIPVV